MTSIICSRVSWVMRNSSSNEAPDRKTESLKVGPSPDHASGESRRRSDERRCWCTPEGRNVFQRGDVVLPDVVQEVATLLASSISKKAQLTFDVAPDLPNIESDADPDDGKSS